MLQYIKDDLGEEALVTPSGLQVMMKWEKPYMEACINTIKPSGDVLEIGFGLAYSANAIQKYKPASHTIIECDQNVLKKAREWAEKHDNINIIEGRWQDALVDTGKFDTIFFDDYAPILQNGIPVFLQQHYNTLERTLEKCSLIRFNDFEVEQFLKEINNREDFAWEELLLFLNKLLAQDNISETQKDYIINNFSNYAILKYDRLVSFIINALDNHMRPEAKLSAYIDRNAFKSRQKLFEMMLSARSDVKYNKKTISIIPSKICSYYDAHDAIIIEIKKI